jgi:hypothetical protein
MSCARKPAGAPLERITVGPALAGLLAVPLLTVALLLTVGLLLRGTRVVAGPATVGPEVHAGMVSTPTRAKARMGRTPVRRALLARRCRAWITVRPRAN